MKKWPNKMPVKYSDLAVKYTSELVKLDSSNPPGNEKDTSKYVANILKGAGFKVEIQEFEPNRCNVIAALGDFSDVGMIWNGHLDVVPAFGKWKYPKFGGEIHEGLLFGRGSCDMKSGIGAMMATGVCIAENQLPLNKGLLMIFVSDEENVNKGIRDITKRYTLEALATIVGEPTELKVCIGNKGYSSFYIKTTGVSCHASKPEKGVNAIYKMARIINRLEEYSLEIIPKKQNQYLGKASLSVGTIKGGSKINIVPDQCICEVERRTLPGEKYEDICEQIQEVVGDLGQVLPRSFISASFTEPSAPLVNIASSAVADALGKDAEIDVFKAGTEACFFTSLGIPTIILGPGSLDQAHKIDEYVEVEQIQKCSHIYYKIARQYLYNFNNIKEDLI